MTLRQPSTPTVLSVLANWSVMHKVKVVRPPLNTLVDLLVPNCFSSISTWMVLLHSTSLLHQIWICSQYQSLETVTSKCILGVHKHNSTRHSSALLTRTPTTKTVSWVSFRPVTTVSQLKTHSELRHLLVPRMVCLSVLPSLPPIQCSSAVLILNLRPSLKVYVLTLVALVTPFGKPLLGVLVSAKPHLVSTLNPSFVINSKVVLPNSLINVVLQVSHLCLVFVAKMISCLPSKVTVFSILHIH
mmetsp:Transcript_7980/g.12105  ORF Transcript_7980/g.12105 Transcript_7980/m.12105 type:complete len:244 (+) Transcript_7980:939-1670(+)